MKNRKGFSMAEILIVVAIIAILSGATIIGVASWVNRAKDTRANLEASNAYNFELDARKAVESVVPSAPSHVVQKETMKDGSEYDMKQEDSQLLRDFLTHYGIEFKAVQGDIGWDVPKDGYDGMSFWDAWAKWRSEHTSGDNNGNSGSGDTDTGSGGTGTGSGDTGTGSGGTGTGSGDTGTGSGGTGTGSGDTGTGSGDTGTGTGTGGGTTDSQTSPFSMTSSGSRTVSADPSKKLKQVIIEWENNNQESWGMAHSQFVVTYNNSQGGNYNNKNDTVGGQGSSNTATINVGVEGCSGINISFASGKFTIKSIKYVYE